MNPISKEEMIKAIQDGVSDKSLTFGCRIMAQGYDQFGAPEKEYEDIIIKESTVSIQRTKGVMSTVNLPGVSIINGQDLIKEYIAEGQIIGHPVLIGDVLDWIEPLVEKEYKAYEESEEDESSSFYNCRYTDEKVCSLRKDKRKPIEEQSSECIEFVYSLLSL